MSVERLFDLSGRTALVTGSTRGIGAALAHALSDAGATVATHGLSEGAGYRADLGEVSQCRTLVAEVERDLDRIDIVILNGATDLRRPWLETSASEAADLFAANFISTLVICQALLPGMRARGWGRIVTIGSIQEVRPNPNYLVYAAAKAAQTNLVRNLAGQVGASGVTINNLAPGAIATDRNAKTLAEPGYRERVEALVPVGRIGVPQDCVGACLLLASDAGAYINGASLTVDGGWSA